jgi:two-component system, sensor histidine kinase and response regulator
MKGLLTADINERYAVALNYRQIDRFMVQVLWWHFLAIGLLTLGNTVFRLGVYFPSPFSWRVPTLEEGAVTIVLGLVASAIPGGLYGRMRNHYAWRVLLSVSFTAYSYLFVFISGGSIEMHFHFFMIMALLVMYSDWRLGWLVLVLTALHHGVLNYLQPSWVYFYGRNDFAIVAHGLPVAVMALFTTRLCQTQRQSVAILEETRRVQEEDLLKRREAEETLRESEEKSRYVIESAGDAIVSIDAEGAIREFNRAAERLFGYTAAEMAGESLTRLIPERFHEAHRADLHRSLESGERRLRSWRNLDLVGLTQDGRELPLEMSFSRFEARGRSFFTGILRDISHRKQVEAELGAARDRALEASRLKSEFLARMSHEIRTPMNGIIGMTGLLLDTELTAGQRHHAETVRKSADALLTIINDILDFSKIEAGRLRLEPVSFDIMVAVEEVGELLSSAAAEKGLDLIIRIAPDVPRHVVGDPGRIRQILINLANNAIKFTATGHVLLNLEREESAEGEVLLRFGVSDTGIGIAEDRLEHIFDKFTQVDASSTRRYGGTGLGLAISRELVILMGGTLRVTSRLGEGSTFTARVRLPIGAASPRATTAALELSGVRGLIVDDNEINRQVLRERLASWRMRADDVASAAAALAALRAAAAAGDPYGVVLTDFEMPDGDGETLARAVRSDPVLRGVPMVLLTSVDQPEGAEHVRAAGFGAYLVKPVRASLLMDALLTVCGARLEGEAGEMVTQATLMGRGSERAQVQPGPGALLHVRVLLVEDNAVNQQVATAMLEQLGARVDVAADGKEALEQVALLPYDLIFMDCEMPEMDGYAATAEIRRREDGGRRIPIVAMTAHAMEGDREQCLAAGMDDYITKPVSPAAIGAVVRRWVRTPGVRNAAAPAETQPAALDAARIAQLRATLGRGDGAQFRRLIETFLGDTGVRLGELRQCLNRKDAAMVRRLAHTLRGSCLSLGALRMTEVASALERVSAQGDGAAASLVDQLEAEFRRAESALVTLLEPGQT